MRNAYSALVGRFGAKRLLGRPKCRWRKCNINFKGIWVGSQDWNQLTQDGVQWHALLNTIMNLQLS
jgi:hypothetical protein